MTQDITLSFGKYRNQNISVVAKTDFSYLYWLSENAFDASLKESVKTFIDEYKQIKGEQGKTIIVDNNLTFNFGKFSGKTFKVVYRENPRYFNWVVRTFVDDTVLVDSINLFLTQMKPIQKRLNKIVKFIKEQIAESERIVKFNQYLVQKEKQNVLYSDMLNLNLDDFFIVNGRYLSNKIFCKITSISIDNHNDDTLHIGSVRTNVDYYYFDAIKGMTLMQKHYYDKTVIITEVPTKYTFDYDIYFLVERNLYNSDGVSVKDTDEKSLLRTETHEERIMSDVWDNVSYTYFKDTLLYVSGEFVSNNGARNSISIKDKFVVCTITQTNLPMLIRYLKLIKIKSKI